MKFGEATVRIVVDHCGLTTQTMKRAVLKLRKLYQDLLGVVLKRTTSVRRYVAADNSGTKFKITLLCLAVVEIHTTKIGRHAVVGRLMKSLPVKNIKNGMAIIYMK